MRGAFVRFTRVKIRVDFVPTGLSDTLKIGGLHQRLAGGADMPRPAQVIMSD